MFILTYSILCVLGGWLLRGALGGRLRRVENPHRLGDSDHIWIAVRGRICAFSDDQVDVAAARAVSLDDPKKRLRRILLWILAVSGLIVVMLLTACGPAAREPIATGKVYGAAELPGWKGDAVYGEINSKWLPVFHARWKADLFKKGVVKWEERFDCNRFASHYAAAVQIEYFVDNFHSWTAGRAAAVSEVWYLAGGLKPHAINRVRTERGVLYIEPETGRELSLTDVEKKSIYFDRT